MIDISIIVPVYNGENTIEYTLNSILQQTYNNFEVIIVNDGSTDNTMPILKKKSSQDNRIKIVNQKNSGVSNARNKGIINSRGKYISFLDSDDIYAVDFLEKMISKISNMDICYCGSDYLPNSKKFKFADIFTTENVLVNYIKGRLPVNTNTWLIKKKLITENKITFRENIDWGEDVEFFYSVISASNKITFVPEYLTFYRKNHSENQLSNFSLDKLDKDYEFIKRVVNNKNINKNSEIEDALLNYRLPALVGNKLWMALQYKYDYIEVKKYYEKYKRYLEDFDWSNGARSVKLNMTKYKIRRTLRKLEKNKLIY